MLRLSHSLRRSGCRRISDACWGVLGASFLGRISATRGDTHLQNSLLEIIYSRGTAYILLSFLAQNSHCQQVDYV